MRKRPSSDVTISASRVLIAEALVVSCISSNVRDEAMIGACGCSSLGLYDKDIPASVRLMNSSLGGTNVPLSSISIVLDVPLTPTAFALNRTAISG